YDSWGVAVLNSNGIEVSKQVGVVTTDPLSIHGNIGIGHTRWATHGAVTEDNAHPHYAADKSFVLAHNGITENAEELKAMLEKKGHEFHTETDTETIVRLIEEKRKQLAKISRAPLEMRLREAVRAAFKDLRGRNTIIILAKDGEVIAARNGSPLVLGTKENRKNNSELYFSSDVLSFGAHVSSVLVMENGQMVSKNAHGVQVMDIAKGTKVTSKFEKNAIVGADVDKGAYDHYMLKEIHDNPLVIRQVLKELDANYKKLATAIKKAKTVYMIGSGTAGAAAAQIAFYLRVYGKIRAVSLIGAEASDYYPLIRKGDLLISPSQSGETADVLEVLELAKKRGAQIASHVNMPGSMMTRMSDFKFMAQAGPEICVMSTKIFVSQIAWGYLVAKAVGGKLTEGKKNLQSLANTVDRQLKDAAWMSDIRKLATKLARTEDLYLLGKGQNLQIIKEGMVKIIEGSYIHAHGIPAGDLKHYAITLMEEGTPVIAVVSNDELKASVLNAIHEVKARGAKVVGVSPTNADQFNDWLKVPDTRETSAIMNVVPLQLLAYYMALARGNNIDKPRNIAKSVTVK
ncbi:MAG: glutamine--fructose-6-phosphate transaminase (isomerizing), partial [Patescibacteria group bacterium]